MGTTERVVSAERPFDPAQERDIRAHLEHLLATPMFVSAPRRRTLLTYLVERTLAGEGDLITEYSLGIDVFEKLPSFDPRTESMVRTDVMRLRRALRKYYAEEGRDEPVLLDLPPRSYAVSITFRDEIPTPVSPAGNIAQSERKKLKKSWVVAGVFVLAVAVLGGITWWAFHRSAIPVRTLVVLPFRDASSDHKSEYLADGLTDELTNELANVKGLRVIARTSAFAFKGKSIDVRDIGQRLNAGTSLEGSVDREGDHIRIRVQLDRNTDGSNLWSRAYEVQFRDLLAVQRDIARSIADDLEVSRPLATASGAGPIGSRHDPDPQAHELYLRGMELSNLSSRESLRRSAELFQAAVDRDPRFAQAWVALALAHWNGHIWGDNTSIETVRSEVEAALDADPGFGLAHAMLGQILWRHDLNWPRAEPEFRLALAQGQGNAEVHARYASSLVDRGLFTEAHRQYRIAQELSPLEQEYFTNEGILYGHERNFAEAERIFRNVLARTPKNAKAMAQLAIVKVLSGDCKGADFWRKEFAKISPGSRLDKDLSWALLVCRGDTATARRMLENDPPPLKFDEAIDYAALGMKQRAIECLRQSIERREVGITTLKVTPFFATLHGDPGFIALERQIGLEP